MKFDGKAFGEEFAAFTRDFVERKVAPALARLDAVEKEWAELLIRLESAEKALADQPKPEPIDMDAMMSDLEERMGERLAALPKAATAEEVAALMPAPKDGKDGADGAPGAAGEPGEKGDTGQDGKSGVGLAGVLKDHEGCVVFTLSDGTIAKLGKFDGKDGEPGKDGAPGRDVDPEVVRATIHEEVQKQVTAPLADAYKGVWKPSVYKRGDAVTWAGSLFIASADTEAKPESGDDWRLAVKRGRDGKDGEAPKPPPTVKL